MFRLTVADCRRRRIRRFLNPYRLHQPDSWRQPSYVSRRFRPGNLKNPCQPRGKGLTKPHASSPGDDDHRPGPHRPRRIGRPRRGRSRRQLAGKPHVPARRRVCRHSAHRTARGQKATAARCAAKNSRTHRRRPARRHGPGGDAGPAGETGNRRPRPARASSAKSPARWPARA